jgi:hypothetical protein
MRLKNGMKPSRTTIGISAGIMITIITILMALRWAYVAMAVCTGTSAAEYQYARVCSDGFINHVSLFAAGSFALLAVLLMLVASTNLKPIIRRVALGVFVVYALWAALFSSSVWDTPYFMAYFYDPSRSGALDLNCLECRAPTATP